MITFSSEELIGAIMIAFGAGSWITAAVIKYNAEVEKEKASKG